MSYLEVMVALEERKLKELPPKFREKVLFILDRAASVHKDLNCDEFILAFADKFKLESEGWFRVYCPTYQATLKRMLDLGWLRRNRIGWAEGGGSMGPGDPPWTYVYYTSRDEAKQLVDDIREANDLRGDNNHKQQTKQEG